MPVPRHCAPQGPPSSLGTGPALPPGMLAHLLFSGGCGGQGSGAPVPCGCGDNSRQAFIHHAQGTVAGPAWHFPSKQAPSIHIFTQQSTELRDK